MWRDNTEHATEEFQARVQRGDTEFPADLLAAVVLHLGGSAPDPVHPEVAGVRQQDSTVLETTGQREDPKNAPKTSAKTTTAKRSPAPKTTAKKTTRKK